MAASSSSSLRRRVTDWWPQLEEALSLTLERDRPVTNTDGPSSDTSSSWAGKFSECRRVYGSSESNRTPFILKLTVIGELDERAGDKWARDVRSFLAEHALYSLAASQRQTLDSSSSQANLTPHVHGPSFSNFEAENPVCLPSEAVLGDAEALKTWSPSPELCFGYLLEDLFSAGYEQRGCISWADLLTTVRALARFHVAYLVGAQNDYCNLNGLWALGTFWTRDKRGSAWRKEVDGMEKRWKDFLEHWAEDILEYGVAEEKLRSFGGRLAEKAEVLADHIDKLPRNKLIHGDCKVANVFYKTDTDGSGAENAVRFIDFQWTGLGSEMLDLAYLVASSLYEGDLDKFSEKELLTAYWEAGGELVENRYNSLGLLSQQSRSIEEGIRDYKIAFLDYARVVVSYMWDGKVDREAVRKRASKVNMCLHNRSPAHILWLTRKAIQYLDEIKI